jgi:hypothetical protein
MISDKFIRAYQKEYENNPSAYRDTAHYLNICLHTHESCCKSKPQELQIRHWLLFLPDPELLGYKMAFLSGDAALLNDALYQSAVITHAQKISDSGCDHCTNARAALKALAAGLTERVPLLLPEELGMSTNGHPVPVTISNLIMALWYKRADFEAESRKKAERTLGTKQSAIDHAAIRYLVALLDEDAPEAGAQLELYCRSVARVQEYGVTKLNKLFWPFAHGLYNLAFAVWEKTKALTIPLPETDCFCAGFAKWQIEHDFQPGKLFVEYPAPLDLVDRILCCVPPACTLYQPYLHMKEDPNVLIPRNRKQYIRHGKHFEEQMMARLIGDGEQSGRI